MFTWGVSPNGHKFAIMHHPLFDGEVSNENLFTSEEISILNKLANETPIQEFFQEDYDNRLDWVYNVTLEYNKNIIKQMRTICSQPA